MDKDKIEILKKEVLRIREIENGKPLKISVMGQTGVGKSSLINALFGAKLKTDAVRPCTKEIERVVFKGNSNETLEFYDLPGVGESDLADKGYLNSYIRQIQESDVILWAIHADNRSTKFDLDTIKSLYSHLDDQGKKDFASKITFVLTKSDLITYSPWVLGKISDTEVVFSPTKETSEILAAKEEYYKEAFITPFSHYMTSTTYNDCGFKLELNGFFYDKFTVGVDGYKSEQELEKLALKYPKYKDIFVRIGQNYEVIPCSSLFRYNLNKLMLVVVNKLGNEASGRFQKFLSKQKLDTVSLEKAKNFSNIIAIDMNTRDILSDLSRQLE